MSPRTPEEARYAFDLFMARRQGRFAEVFADYEQRCEGIADTEPESTQLSHREYQVLTAPGDRGLYLEVAAELEGVMSQIANGRGRRKSKERALRKIIRSLIRRLYKPGPSNDAQIINLARMLGTLADSQERRERGWSISMPNQQALAFWTYVHFGAACRKQGINPDPEVLVNVTRHALKRDAISITDIRRAVMEWTAFIPLEAWIEVACQEPRTSAERN